MEELSTKMPADIQKWLEIFHQCRDSGLSNQQWCEQNGISLKRYYYWLAKIRKMAVEPIPRKQTAAAMATDWAVTTVFASLPAMNHAPVRADSVRIHIGSAVIEIPPNTPDFLIQPVILAASKC